MSAPIKLNGYHIVSIDYKTNVDVEKFPDPDNSGFEQTQEFGLTDDLERGIIKLKYDCYDIKRMRIVSVMVEGQFTFDKSSEYYNEESVQGLMAVNGSAILFPYVRAIVSMVTTLDSSDAIVLPTVNFIEDASDEDTSSDKLEE